MKTTIPKEAMFKLVNKSVVKIPKVKADELEEVLDIKCPRRHSGRCRFEDCKRRSSECQLHRICFRGTRCADSTVKQCTVCNIKVCAICRPILHPNGDGKVVKTDEVSLDAEVEEGFNGDNLMHEEDSKKYLTQEEEDIIEIECSGIEGDLGLQGDSDLDAWIENLGDVSLSDSFGMDIFDVNVTW